MTETKTGAFVASLKRNNKQIRDDRAQAIAEDTQIVYKRQVEDLEYLIKKKKREREQMMDLSPTNAQSLVLANEFDAKAFVARELKLGVEIRNLTIKLNVAKTRYAFLFEGSEIEDALINADDGIIDADEELREEETKEEDE